MELRLDCAFDSSAFFFCLTSHACIVGWPKMVRVQPPRRKTRRQGMRWATMKSEVATMVRYRKMVEDNISFEKLVLGATVSTTLS